ncbi:flagellar hook-length control protein FliK [Tardiphaga alba]|uniref:flagellar hook-length control protein FliK n=1 Tax=Tardiphaga alba TaxID=340268 RepID=UPI002E1C7CB9
MQNAQLILANALASSKLSLTPQEAVAVSTATQSAVTQQTSLANLFANLGAATSLANLPPKLQQAVAQVLAQRPQLDTQLTGGEVKTAFQNSGLFLESSLAQGLPASGAMPDMKAALIVLKQALTTALGSNGSATTAPTAQQPAQAQPGAATLPAVPTTPAQIQAAAATLVPAMLPKSAMKGDLSVTPDGALPDDTATPDLQTQPVGAVAKTAPVATREGAPQQLATRSMNILAQAMSEDAALLEAIPAAKGQSGAPLAEILGQRPQVPPPPLRGALPSAQPMMQPTLPPNAQLGPTIEHLLSDTDAAIARQTLHQVASLPDRVDAVYPQRADQVAQRWSFEIPFAMPHGTAVAQFEIARDDGQGSEVEAAKKIWRARFSLDVEPAGPVHALVSLTGDKTSVRMWAERPATALQLQAGAAQLSQALLHANLQPGDIVIREGAPVQPQPAAAGHFLDRAL